MTFVLQICTCDANHNPLITARFALCAFAAGLSRRLSP